MDALKVSILVCDSVAVVAEFVRIAETVGLPKKTPLLAVTIPTESILLTSSYVKVPAIETLPVKVAATPVMFVTAIVGVPVNP